MRKSGFLVALVAAVIAGCGGGGAEDDAFQPAPPPPSTTPAATISTVTLATSSPTLLSDGSVPVEISAFVRNANNQFVEGVPVQFAVSSGGFTPIQGTTDANGVAKATVTPAGDPSRRTITVTATAGSTTPVSGTVRVDVIGSTLTIQGPVSLSSGQQGTYEVQLLNAGGTGIPNTPVTISSARGNTLSATSITTASSGRASFTMTASNSAADTITATALGVTSTLAVAVNADSFTFTSPAAATEIPLNTNRTVTVRLLSSGAPQVGRQISFSTTRGTVTPTTAATAADGTASAVISATNAGAAIITASAQLGGTAQIPVEFVAQTPANIDVQPSVFTLETGAQSTIIAIVRDAAGNLVKNQDVDFTLQDITGGTLSVGTGRTDSQGRTQTVYTASSQTSANEGVQITARVRSNTSVNRTVALTVARRQVFIALGTGNTIEERDEATYRIRYTVQVTDSNGNGVANVPVSLRILSTRYYKGFRVLNSPPLVGWGTTYTVPFTPPALPGCADEDVNRNGILDPGEDFNSSGRLEAGNIALTTPSNATTDAAGTVLVDVLYPQEWAFYLDVELSASTTVQGTEYVRTSRFMLPGSAADFNTSTTTPPGPVSPVGRATSCSDPN